MEKTFTPKTQMSFAACMALQKIENADLQLHELRCSMTGEQYRQSIEAQFEIFKKSIMADAVAYLPESFQIDEDATAIQQNGCLEILERMRIKALACNLYLNGNDKRQEFFNGFRQAIQAEMENLSIGFIDDTDDDKTILKNIECGNRFKLETVSKCEHYIDSTANLFGGTRKIIDAASAERCKALHELKEVVAKIDATEDGQLFAQNAA